MVFSSAFFLFFYLLTVLAVYYGLPRRFRNIWLFLASIFFYGYGEPVYVILFLLSILGNYLCGLALENRSPRGKKWILGLCVAGNLLYLGFFKYTTLVVDTLQLLPGFENLPDMKIALPIGISFFTFQSMSYVIDVYWGNCQRQRNFITFGTYVALFPQLIAGPIVRYVDVENQLQTRRESMPVFNHGVKLFLVGLAKKVLLANPLGLLWTQLKVMPDANGILGNWAGIIAFSLQIYFDFSGYSDMARGLGNMFGFDFVKNFDYPYLCRSITEFWRRWHISLSTWFREYVYIPLGGNRKGKARQCLNLMIVWGLTGLWHGASWNFLLWGLYFGVLLIVEKLFLLKSLKKLPGVLHHIYALFFVVIGWVLFDFTDFSQMLAYLGSLFTGSSLLGGQAGFLIRGNLVLLVAGIAFCLPCWKGLYLRVAEKNWGWIADLMGTVLALLLCTAALISSTYNPFLYFRF